MGQKGLQNDGPGFTTAELPPFGDKRAVIFPLPLLIIVWGKRSTGSIAANGENAVLTPVGLQVETSVSPASEQFEEINFFICHQGEPE
jgi:hypothetical protein